MRPTCKLIEVSRASLRRRGERFGASVPTNDRSTRMARLRSALVLSFVLLAAPAFAQIGQGTLTGVITDPQGQVLPGVTVTATSTALIGTRTTVTEVDGRYRFPALPSGFYKLKFDLAGFSTLERDNIQVVLGQTISVDTQMKIASLAETVTVQGAVTGR